jgi:hypothetical protein
VLGILILFIGISVVSSTGILVNNIDSYTKNHNSKEDLEDLHFRGDYGYAYNAYPGPEETFYFLLNDTSEYTPCGDTISGDFLYGGTIDCNGIWYASQYGIGHLYGIDTNNGCEMWSIEGGGYGGYSELAWDDCTYALYGISDEFLFEIDPETGEADYIGNIDVSLSQIEFDDNGIFYGFELLNTGNVYTINLSTFETTLVGTLSNITSTFCLSIAFDKDTNNLYLLGGGHLYICDTETYKCTLISGNMSSGIEGTSFVIPYGDDTTPPVSTHFLNPSEPDGNNGWYVGVVNVTLTATDDNSGVKEIRYKINNGADQLVIGDNGSFILYEEGNDILIEYWAIDNAGNVETKNSFIIDIDRSLPEICLTYEVIGGNRWTGWFFEFTACAVDEISGMDCVEFYLNDEIMTTIHGPGPEYTWIYHWPGLSDTKFRVRGFICNLEITDEYVDFYALMVKISNDHLEKYDFIACGYDNAGNKDCDGLVQPCLPLDTINPGFYMFRKFTLPNNYTGYIGDFFIYATFSYG